MSTRPTYIYADKLRNIIVAHDLFLRTAKNKTESWRLGYETSEDALTWNVFVGLMALQGLAQVFQRFTGMEVNAEPELYLWGTRIDEECGRLEALEKVRLELESDLRIKTEPDIILRIPDRAIILIEAKFGSHNGTIKAKQQRFGPVANFLRRYRAKEGCCDPLKRDWIAKQKEDEVLEQLCRNVIFAQWLAGPGEAAFVVNLLRLKECQTSSDFSQHLSEDGVVHFRRHTWEELYPLPAVQSREGAPLRDYMQSKTLRLEAAFDLSPDRLEHH